MFSCVDRCWGCGTTALRDEGVVCNEGEDASAVTVTRQDAMQLGLKVGRGGLSQVSRGSPNQMIKCKD